MEADEPSQLAPSLPEENKDEFTYSEEFVFYNEQLSRVTEEQLIDWHRRSLLYNFYRRSLVALIFWNASKKINTGSGVLISRDVILTAANNIFNKELEAENSDFKIYIGTNGEDYYQVEAWRYPEEFKTCKPSAKLSQDYAIIKLKNLVPFYKPKPVQFDQLLSLCLPCEECTLKDNKNITLKLFGFPYTYPQDAFGNARSFEGNLEPLDESGKKIKFHQYGLAREGSITVIDASQKLIGYGISALPGQNGCPVVMGNSIMAVHLGGDRGKFNVGRIVDASLITNLWRWREEINGSHFFLKDDNVCMHIKEILEKMQYKLNRVHLGNVVLREYTNLLELCLIRNNLQQIDLSHCPRLTILDLGNNQLCKIDLANNKHLTHLYLNNNHLQEIDLSNNINLIHLSLSSNQIAQIDLTKHTKLERLTLWYNRLIFVRLCIDENVEAYYFIHTFCAFNQSSATCRIQLKCHKGQCQAARNKTIRILDVCRLYYSQESSNRKKCAYCFLVLL